jgi:hypothetical protein
MDMINKAMRIDKACKKCGKIKPLNAFPNHKKMRDGHLSQCRECRKLWEAHYAATEKGKAAAERGRKKYRSLKPERTRIYGRLGYALSAGKISKPEYCLSCGASGRLEAHHPVYSLEHSLSVQWLCNSCHKTAHKKESA